MAYGRNDPGRLGGKSGKTGLTGRDRQDMVSTDRSLPSTGGIGGNGAPSNSYRGAVRPEKVVPSRFNTWNFDRAPTLSELGKMASIAGSTLTGSTSGVMGGIYDALTSNKGTTASGDFQGAVSRGNGQLETKGKSGAATDIAAEGVKKKKKAAGTLLGSVGDPLGSVTNPLPIS